jgi:Tol biopolymer transport system component/DNA-binding winged helix-turn-helix (wHTH) protein
MAETRAQAAVFQFGVFELDACTGELRKRGVRLKLQEQPIQILLLLLEHPGQLVTREEIKARLWPGNTFVDFDNAINTAVRKLRDCLNDSAETPRFVETLARRGYRFVATVSQMPGELPPAVRSGWSWRLAAFASFFLVAAIGTGVWLMRWNSRGLPLLKAAPLTSYSGHERQPSFSPDGSRIAFTWGGPDGKNQDIYVKLIGPGEPFRLTKDPAVDSSPAWSPDGRWIAFLREIGRDLSVLITPAAGGPERELARVNYWQPGSDEFACKCVPFPGSMLAWSPDGRWLFTSGRNTPASPLSIIGIALETSEQHVVTTPPPIAADGSPAISGDGRWLAFLRTTGLDLSDIWVMPLKEASPVNPPRRITFDGSRISTPVWIGGGELLFSSNRLGEKGLWRIAIAGSRGPVRVPLMTDDAGDLAFSPLARRLVFSHSTARANIWRVPIRNAAGSAPERLMATSRGDYYPQYSPDGKRLAFQSDRSGTFQIWIADADGSNALQLTQFGQGFSGSPRWSPDGRHIAFDSNAAGSWDVYVVTTQGGRPARLTTDPADDVTPTWSRDGRWIYFSSKRTGRYEIWKVPANGGPAIQVTRTGGFLALESADGNDLYFWSFGYAGPLRKMAIERGTETQVIASLYARNFQVTGHGIYFIDGTERAATLGFYDFATGSSFRLSPLGRGVSFGMDASPDEQWVVFSRVEDAGTDLMLTESFH